ncbi:MAG: cell wall metabolism sensor histidine kinase WalK [Clostridia bacterium]|jgi:two-component system phosphate regulon sensor histidine kinase PhoR|nr:cell wall metabolism sensor histidine kinase WalK [Clostridia bacterium]
MKKFTLKIAAMYFLITAAGFFVIKLITYFLNRELRWFELSGVLLVCLLVFLLWINYYSKVFMQLNDLVHNFAHGKLVDIEENFSDDEIGELSKTLQQAAYNSNATIRKMLQERDQMKTILASMVEGVLAFDLSGRLLLINETAEEMLNVDREKVQGHYFLEILPNYQVAYLLNRCLVSGESQMTEVKLSSVEQEYYRVYINPIKGTEKNIQGAIMVLRNITKLRQLEEMRTEFIANVSHELRTPLTSIKGYVETLLDGAIEDREYANKFLSIINTETNRLNSLIRDLLFLSELESGDMDIVKTKIDSLLLLEKVINLLEPIAAKKNLTIMRNVVPGAETFRGSQDMLEQVLINLLDNAIKYSYEGGTIRIQIEPELEHDSGEEKIVIKVINQGMVIPAESLPRLFERFYRVDKARSRQVGGTGLGLSIVKHVVERHRGSVQATSSEEEGTIFTVILPKK